MNDVERKISELKDGIMSLPDGSLTAKTIKGRTYYYHRVVRNGKRVERYVGFEEVEELRRQIDQRKALEKELRRLERYLPEPEEGADAADGSEYRAAVLTGRRLGLLVSQVKDYRKRACIGKLREYVFGKPQGKVFILYGLRRTGKTTMAKQILSELPDGEFNRAAFIQISAGNTLEDINADLRLLERKGFRYVFLDEVTLLKDFIEGAALFSDVYASSGMKLILTGTDSLGFVFTKSDQLYDRCVMLHTTFISYHEFESVLGIQGIDEYIRYGGTMSMSGINYNEDSTFASAQSSGEYIDTAIAKNIQHSLKFYQDGSHFRQLHELYAGGELTNVINRVVENMNHSFTVDVIEKTFESSDISVMARNMLHDRVSPIDIKAHLNLDTVTFGIMQALDILNREERTVAVEESHMLQIREYLMLLDLVAEVDLVSLPDVGARRKITVITQPGLRYSQADAIVRNMLLDEKFCELSLPERRRVLERLDSEILGRMMEDIVLLETKLALPHKEVFKLQFAVGEFDMVVFDPQKQNCRIYEVKHSQEAVSAQYRFLADEEKCAMTEHRFGEITGKYVIYRGRDTVSEEIRYLNVEGYLNSLWEGRSED